MARIERAQTGRYVEAFGALLIVLILVKQMFVSTTMGWNTVLHNMMCFGTMAQFALVFYCVYNRRGSGTAVKLASALLIWYVVTRPILGDLDLSKSNEQLVLYVVYLCMMCYMASVSSASRKKVLGVFISVVCAFNLAVCIGELYAAMHRTTVTLPLYIEIGMQEESGLNFVTLTRQHRNLSAQWNCLCFCLVIYLASLCRKKLWRIPFILAAAAFYAAVAISLSRTTMITLAVAAAMLVMLAVDKYVRAKRTAVRVLALAAVVIIVTPLSYKSFDLIGTAVEKLSSSVTAATEVETVPQTAPSEEKTAAGEPSAQETAVQDGQAMFTDVRGTENVKALGGRTLVWKSIYTTLRLEPHRLLYGGLTDEYMSAINIIIAHEDPLAVVKHTHNVFLETLMLTGLPGLLLALAFTLILLWRMVRVFFAAGAELSVKLLTLPLATVLLKNMGEATLLRYDDITNYVFFLAAGAFLAFSYELFPEKSRKK